MTTQEEMAGLPAHTQFRLLKKSIPQAIVMTKVLTRIPATYLYIIFLIVKVWGFNVANVEHEMEMVFSETDMQMFR